MPHLRSSRSTALLLLPALLVPTSAGAQAVPAAPTQAPATATPDTSTPATAAPTAPAAPTVAPTLPPASSGTALPGVRPTPAQQAVLDRIRRLRDGDQRRFGSCSYRWDRWKLQADGSRTTNYSCDGGAIVERTISVHCGRLQINSYEPLPAGKGEGWAWGSWRLPQAGGEERMVATLCANALPIPPAPVKPPTGATPATKTPPSPR